MTRRRELLFGLLAGAALPRGRLSAQDGDRPLRLLLLEVGNDDALRQGVVDGVSDRGRTVAFRTEQLPERDADLDALLETVAPDAIFVGDIAGARRLVPALEADAAPPTVFVHRAGSMDGGLADISMPRARGAALTGVLQEVPVALQLRTLAALGTPIAPIRRIAVVGGDGDGVGDDAAAWVAAATDAGFEARIATLPAPEAPAGPDIAALQAAGIDALVFPYGDARAQVAFVAAAASAGLPSWTEDVRLVLGGAAFAGMAMPDYTAGRLAARAVRAVFDGTPAAEIDLLRPARYPLVVGRAGLTATGRTIPLPLLRRAIVVAGRGP